MQTPDKILNRFAGLVIESNYVYPPIDNIKLICQVSPDWLKSELRKKYAANVIGNKYVICLHDKLYYRADDIYWLIELNNTVKHKSDALNAFKRQYPNITSADLQTFLMGYQARENK